MKKNICKLLAFIMIICAVSADKRGPFVEEARAADFGSAFQYHQDKVLSRETPPKLLAESSRYNTDSQNEVLFSLPSGTSGTDINGAYTLEYAYAEGFFAQVKFAMGDSQIGVTYQLIDATGNPYGRYKFVEQDHTANPKTPIAGIRYYAETTDGAEGRVIINTDNQTGLSFPDDKTLSYNLTRGGGISFKVMEYTAAGVETGNEIETVKLFWSNSGGNTRIYYSTNRAEQGPRIYPFTLKGASERTFAINTGYNLKTDPIDVPMSRTADEYYTVTYPALAPAWDTDGSGEYILDYTYIESGETRNNEYPPATNSSIIFDFTIPQKIELDNTSPNYLKFVPVTAADNVTLYFDGNLGDKAISVDNVMLPKTSEGGNVIYTPPSSPGGGGELEVRGLPPSTLFNGFSFYVGPARSAKTGPYGAIDGDYNYILGDKAAFDRNIYSYLQYALQEEEATSCVLKILEPYKSFMGTYNIPGTYRVFRGRSRIPSGEPYATAYVGDNDKSESLSIPINFESASDTTFYYRVDFVPSAGGGTMSSQTSLYKPSGIADVLPAPKEFRIISSKTVTVEDAYFNGGKQDFARVKFSFEAGLDEVLVNMKTYKSVSEIEYILSYGLTPKSESSLVPFLTLVAPLTGASPGIDEDTIDLSASDKAKEIHLLSASYATDRRSVNNVYYDYGIITAEVLIPVGSRSGSGSGDILIYPNVYYTSVKGEYIDNTVIGGKRETTFSSNESQLNLNEPVRLTIPAPGNFKAENPGINSFEVSWSLSREELFEYMDYVLNPAKRTFTGIGLTTVSSVSAETSITYDLYIGRDSAEMKKLVEGKTAPANITDVDGSESGGNVVYGSDTSVTANLMRTDAAGDYVFDPGAYIDPRDFLRNGGVYRITNLEQRDFSPQNGERGKTDLSFGVTFEGLDDNTPYYVAALTQAMPYETEWASVPNGIGVPKIETEGSADENVWHPVIGAAEPNNAALSGYTAVGTVTTKISTDDPSPDEFVPPAPTGLDKRNQTSDSVDIFWNVLPAGALPDSIANSSNYRIEYQALRVKDYVLPDSFLLNKGIISDIVSDLRNAYPQTLVAAWQTDATFASPTGLLELVPPDRPGPVTHQSTNLENVVLDASLSPGSMYVYYVRTALTDAAGNPLKYSVWVPVSVTSAPIDGPENLRSERTGTYDKFTEAIIAFDAPAQMPEIFPGRTYTLQYSLKQDGADWGPDTNMTQANLSGGVTENTSLPGYYAYQYKITGLVAGSSYSIRVRLVDNVSGDKSAYSNVATHRTEVDPDKPEDVIPKWEDFFKEKAEEILKRPYWPIVDKSGTSFEAAYRGSRFDGVIGGAPNGVISLGKDARSQVYYIPAASFAKAESANESLSATAENVTALVPPGALDSQQTQAIKDIVKQLNDKKIKDYYIQLSLSLSTTSERINGNNPLTDRIDFTVKAVGFTEQEKLWDAEMEAELKTMLNDPAVLNKVRNRLKSAIDAKYTNEEMVALVEQLVADFEQDYLERVRKSFDSHRLYEYEAGYFAQPVRISAVPKQQAGATSISGYQLVQGSWQSLPTTPYGTGRSITPINPGTFIFSGLTVYIPGIENMQGGAAITGLVAKYSLDDFFGKGTSFNTATPLTNDALIGSIARMAGAKNTQDAAAFLREKGITVSTRNAYSPASNETTIYLLMSLYEQKTNTKISSMRITNQNIVRDIPGISPNYAPYYKAAYQMGIMDKNYMPKEQMSVKEYLTILGKLAGKANL